MSTEEKIPLEKLTKEEKSQRPKPDVLLTHGAGSQLDNPSLDAFADGLAATHTVLGFEDQGTVQQRAATFNSLLDTFPSVIAFGGRSKGGVAAVEASLSSNTKKLILFSLPLSIDRSGDPGLQLPQHLLEVQQDVDVLFIGGDRDELCLSEDLAKTKKTMKARSWSIRIEGADHGIKFEMKKRRSVCEFVGQIAGKWLRGDMSVFGKSEKNLDMLVTWNKDGTRSKIVSLEG
jgi:predicted alpha/beta-hydrolase family hydrolase